MKKIVLSIMILVIGILSVCVSCAESGIYFPVCYTTQVIPADGEYPVNLEVDGGHLILSIPADYQYQPTELAENEHYPFAYIFVTTEMGGHFTVYYTDRQLQCVSKNLHRYCRQNIS